MIHDSAPTYAFFGSPEFAAIVLEKLIGAGSVPSLVVCNPDRPVDRKQIITPPFVKRRIMNYESGIKNQIKILQPEKLDSSLFQIYNSKFDFFVVAAYAKIIPGDVLATPRLGVIGVHPSLLPKYRGASPIQSAILNGETETGVTLYLMDEKMDHGPILASIGYQLSGIKYYSDIQKELAELAGDLLIQTIPKFLAGGIKPIEQDHAKATFTKKFKTEDGFVSERDLVGALNGSNQKAATEINRKIRALNPEPGVWTTQPPTDGGKRVKLLEAKVKDGKLILQKIQVDGKKPHLP